MVLPIRIMKSLARGILTKMISLCCPTDNLLEGEAWYRLDEGGLAGAERFTYALLYFRGSRSARLAWRRALYTRSFVL
jgi:hypothetical protein